MDYRDALQYIDSFTTKEMRLGLDALRRLLKRLENPEKDLRFIHIAGTNGKGSVGAYLANVLACSGYKVGRYVSPTIFTYCERIQIIKERESGNMECSYIEEEAVGRHTDVIREAIESMQEDGQEVPTPFEIETALSFLEFREQGCDYVVLEVGLGGIEDATNVVENVELAVLTSISMDHMAVLGDSIEEIAHAKAGIIKHGVDVVCYDYGEYEFGGQIEKVIEGVCQEQEAKITKADFRKIDKVSFTLQETKFFYDGREYVTNLLGENQPKNATLSIESAKVLMEKGLNITEVSIQRGIACTDWKGRFSIVSRRPLVIVDGAHNEDAAKSLAKTMKLYFGERKVVFVVGIFADKDYEKILKITCPQAKKVYVIESDNPRALPSNKLAKVAKRYVHDVVDAKTVRQAMDMIWSKEKEDEIVVVFGSLSFLGDVYRYIDVKS